MNNKRLSFTATLLWLTLLSITTNAQVKLAGLFTDSMVLQQKSTVPIWGWAKLGSNVEVTTSWDKKHYKAQADGSGKFVVKVTTPSYGGPYQVTVSDGKPIVLSNVLIGEVWICTGQSNMEMPVKGFKGLPVLGSNDVILKSKNKNIHLFIVPRASKTEVQQDIKPSQWLEANPESVSNFSATGYYFGRLLNEMLDVPIGLISCCYGGSSVEAWTDANTLSTEFPTVTIPGKNDSIKQVSRTPTTLYNAMLHPIIGYGIKGAIWYQGEANYNQPGEYGKRFEAMIKMWRQQWGLGDFPFYYAQIAPYDYTLVPPYDIGGKFNSAFFRDTQRKETAKIPNSAMAVLIDVGEQNNIHPAHKEIVGTRLSYLALGYTYGVKGFGFQSPQYEAITVTGDIATIKFNNVPNGLTSFGKELSYFEIAGADKHFYPAKAVISGSSVMVSAFQVKAPVAVRYAFKDFVVGDLYGTDGLPVSSFRSDDWDYDAR